MLVLETGGQAEPVEWKTAPIGHIPGFGLLGDAFVYRFPDVGDFVVDRRGTSVRVFPRTDPDSDDFIFVLTRGVLPRVIQLRGSVCLHASGVLVGGRVIGFVGISGSGKSTLAAAMVDRGFPLVSDDVLPLRLSPAGEVLAGPGLADIRLYPSTARALGLDQNVQPPGPGETKARWHPHPDRVIADPFPLSELYLLLPTEPVSPASPGARRGSRLGPGETFRALTGNSFWIHAEATGPLADAMPHVAEVAAAVPLRPLSYQLNARGFAAVGRILRALVRNDDG